MRTDGEKGVLGFRFLAAPAVGCGASEVDLSGMWAVYLPG